MADVFGVVGSGASLSLVTALVARGARFTGVAHEAAGAIASGAVAAASARPSACVTIKGPGLANALPGVALNALENRPAITVAEAYDEPGPRDRVHKRLDHGALLRSLTKAHLGLDGVGKLPDALAAGRAEAPGPIHVDLARGIESRIDAPRAVHDDDVAPVIAAIARSARPVVVAGALALRRPWGARLASLRVPVFTTAAAKGSVDERLPHAAGVFTGEGRSLAPESAVMPHADLVVGLGLRASEVVAARLRAAGPTVLVDEIAPGAASGFDAAARAATRDATAFDAVLDALQRAAWGERDVEDARRALPDAFARGPFLPHACFAALDDLRLDHALVMDEGAYCKVGEHVWRARPGRPYFGTSNARWVGAGIPTALGVSLARPGLPVVCVVGDAGIASYPAEARRLVARRLPVLVTLMRDGRYGSVAANVRGRPHYERALDVAPSDWAATFEAWGAPVARAADADAFRAAVRGWNGRVPAFIEASFDPAPYAEMNLDLRS